MPLKSLDVQATAAKCRRDGPPAVIVRHSSLRERRGVHRHYTRGAEREEGREKKGGGERGSVVQFALAAPPLYYFFHHFCNAAPLALVYASLHRKSEVNAPGCCSGNILWSGEMTRYEIYTGIDSYNDLIELIVR